MGKRKDPHDLDGIIRAEIERQGFSQYRLAKESGVSQSQIQRYVTEQRSMTLDTAAKVCRVLGLGLVRLDDE